MAKETKKIDRKLTQANALSVRDMLERALAVVVSVGGEMGIQIIEEPDPLNPRTIQYLKQQGRDCITLKEKAVLKFAERVASGEPEALFAAMEILKQPTGHRAPEITKEQREAATGTQGTTYPTGEE